MPHLNQATSVVGGTASVIGGVMAQASPEASVSNTGIALAITGVIVAACNGAFPFWKTWLESRRIAADVEALKLANAESERALKAAKDEADRKLADVEARHREDAEVARKKRHDDRDRFQAMYYKLQGDYSDLLVHNARLEGRLGGAINQNAANIEKVAAQLDPPVPLDSPHLPPPLPSDSGDDLDAYPPNPGDRGAA